MSTAAAAKSRDDLFSGKLTDAWATAAGKEQDRFEAFCKRLSLPSDHAYSVVLYLTWLYESERATGKRIHLAVSHLDTIARIRGTPPWRRQPDVATFLRGFHRHERLGPHPEAADPLYRELVEVLITAVTALTPNQQRDRVAVLLAHHTGLDIDGLMRLRWEHIRLTRNSAEIRAPEPTGREWLLAAQGGITCVVDALSRLGCHRARPQDHLLALGPAARANVEAVLSAADQLGDDLAARVRTATHSSLQMRDRAILLIAYGAALTRTEIISLRQKHVAVTPNGLLVSVPGRPAPTGLRADPGMPGDPVAAWEAWHQTLRDYKKSEPERPAFLRATRRSILDTGISKSGVTLLMDRAASAAGLTGSYTFQSLRWGLIRTAFRADEPVDLVAAHLGLKTLQGAAYHQRRENLVRHSVAGQLGL